MVLIGGRSEWGYKKIFVFRMFLRYRDRLCWVFCFVGNFMLLLGSGYEGSCCEGGGSYFGNWC